MKRILVTGATGNVGFEVAHYLIALNSGSEIIAGIRNENAKQKLTKYPDLHFRTFDFEQSETFSAAFNQIDVLFLLRPPHISEVETFFRPLLVAAKKQGIQNIVFLSVQGVETSKVIPHHKIERLIQDLEFNYIFVRPSYFMQNLTSTLLPEIQDKRSITLPAGHAKFNWIDVKNIGKAAATLIHHFEKYQNQSYEITGTENKDFEQVAKEITEVTGENIVYKSVNPISFYLRKKKEGITSGFALVMTFLHFLPRFQSEPNISDNYKLLTGENPTTLNQFLVREKGKLTSPIQ